MTIGIILLWMAMQGRNLVPDANGNITAQSVTFAPAEHIIEIKTKREQEQALKWYQCSDSSTQYCDYYLKQDEQRRGMCPYGHHWQEKDVTSKEVAAHYENRRYVNWLRDSEKRIFACEPNEPTREIWIDGVKWGVLKGD